MHLTSETVDALVDQLSRLPTVGRKTAQRLAAFILKMPREEVVEIAKAMVAAKDRVKTCSVCFNVTDVDPCPVCQSAKRDRSVICVVEEPSDVLALERTGEFRGLYHVLGGVISPLDGIGPEDLNIPGLLARVNEDGVKEVILATSATVDGQTTAHFLADKLAGTKAEVTELAHGVPVGGELDYLDDGTLSAALRDRRPV